ncbi:hypothetical protein EDC04DRAFT_2606440 [Pisolithus marmoratus]|nr:hypothetical protein EDC04DRAFT_2606440 [Pisolithus marmoratus]
MSALTEVGRALVFLRCLVAIHNCTTTQSCFFFPERRNVWCIPPPKLGGLVPFDCSDRLGAYLCIFGSWPWRGMFPLIVTIFLYPCSPPSYLSKLPFKYIIITCCRPVLTELLTNMPQQHAQESTLHTCLGDGNIAAFDARILAKYWDCWVTSANSHYVPELFIFEAKKVAYQDDPTWRWLWWDMTNMPEDFVLERGLMFRVGRVHPDKWKKLEINWTQVIPHYDRPVKVVAWMCLCWHALMCLKQLPFTFRDTLLILTLFQHLSLDIFGMLEYLGSTIPHPDKSMDAIDRWMGAITTNPEICQCLFD